MRRAMWRRVFFAAVALVVVWVVVAGGLATAQKKREVLVWCWSFQQGCIQKALPEFYKAHPDIEVKFLIQEPTDVYQNLLMALNAGAGAPDVAGMESSHLGQFVETGQLFDMTEKAKPYLDKFNKYKWPDAMKDGKIYAMPWDSGPVAIWYRRDAFEKAGYKSDPDSVAKLLDTWNDFYNVAKVMKQKTGKYMFALAKGNNDGRIFEMMIWQRNRWYVDATGKIGIEDPKVLEVLEYCQKFWKEDLVEDTQPWTPGWYAGMDTGNVATIIEAVWMGGFLYNWISPNTGGKWGVVPLPIWEKGDPRTSNDGGSTLVITKLARDKEAAWALVEFVTANKDAQIAAWKLDDSFPSLEAAYDSPVVSEKADYFGGQKYRALFCQLAKDIPPIAYTKDYVECNSLMTPEIAAVALGKKTPAQAIKDAAKAMRDRTKRK